MEPDCFFLPLDRAVEVVFRVYKNETFYGKNDVYDQGFCHTCFANCVVFGSNITKLVTEDMHIYRVKLGDGFRSNKISKCVI